MSMVEKVAVRVEGASLNLLLADCRQALFDAVKADEGASVALRHEIGRAIALIGKAMDVTSEATFLIARIDDLDWCDFDHLTRDWNGHVDPPLCRLRAALKEHDNGGE